MKKIFEEYGGVIHVALAIVALVAVVALLVGGPNGGWIGNAFHGITDKFLDKTSSAMDAVSVNGSGNSSGSGSGGAEESDPDTETITVASTADGFGGHYVQLTGVEIGTELNVSDTSGSVYSSDKNLMPTNDLSVTGNTTIEMPTEYPAGYYALSANIASLGNEGLLPLTIIKNAAGTNIGQSLAKNGAGSYSPQIQDAYNNGRYGAVFYVDEPFSKITIFAANNNSNSIGKTTVLEDVRLSYFPVEPAKVADNYRYTVDYSAEGEETFIVTTDPYNLMADEAFTVSYTVVEDSE